MVFPPLGLWYLAAQLEAQGHTTDFRALDIDPFPEFDEFDQVWISATSSQMHEVRRISQIISDEDWKRNTPVVIGGPAAWVKPEAFDDLGFDLVVSGESDHPKTIKSIVECSGSNTRLARPNITLGELDWVLPPVRRWDERYTAFLEDRSGRKHRTTTLFTSRGCMMACAFCESGRNGVIWDRVVRYEPIETVEAQLREIVERGHMAAMFYDDILPINKVRTQAIMAHLRKYELIWRCFLRTDIISRQGGLNYLREMAESGLVEVLAGVESADNRIKANVHKGTTIEQDTQVLRWCKELGIKFKASIILGLPGEDRESLERTREWILRERPDRVDVGGLIPFPGTPITKSHDHLGNGYDLYWDEEWPEENFYKAKDRATSIITGTSHLMPRDISEFRVMLMEEIKQAGIPY